MLDILYSDGTIQLNTPIGSVPHRLPRGAVCWDTPAVDPSRKAAIVAYRVPQEEKEVEKDSNVITAGLEALRTAISAEAKIAEGTKEKEELVSLAAEYGLSYTVPVVPTSTPAPMLASTAHLQGILKKGAILTCISKPHASSRWEVVGEDYVITEQDVGDYHEFLLEKLGDSEYDHWILNDNLGHYIVESL